MEESGFSSGTLLVEVRGFERSDFEASTDADWAVVGIRHVTSGWLNGRPNRWILITHFIPWILVLPIHESCAGLE
jgi:hypothetical protein